MNNGATDIDDPEDEVGHTVEQVSDVEIQQVLKAMQPEGSSSRPFLQKCGRWQERRALGGFCNSLTTKMRGTPR